MGILDADDDPEMLLITYEFLKCGYKTLGIRRQLGSQKTNRNRLSKSRPSSKVKPSEAIIFIVVSKLLKMNWFGGISPL